MFWMPAFGPGLGETIGTKMSPPHIGVWLIMVHVGKAVAVIIISASLAGLFLPFLPLGCGCFG